MRNTIKLSLFALLLLSSEFANALDIGVGLGACSGGDPADEKNFCKAGVAAKVFVRHIHMVNESIGVEGEIYHFSHPEKQDLDRSRFDERADQHQGVSVNIFYRF